MRKEAIFERLHIVGRTVLFYSLLHLPPALERPIQMNPDLPLAGQTTCLDPGHDDIFVPGTTARDLDGSLLFREQDLTLAVAKKVRTKLEEAGAEVCMSRTDEGKVQLEPEDINGNGSSKRPEDVVEKIQNRIDYMNQFNPNLMLAIHFNGHSDTSLKGTETYFSNTGEYGDNNRLFAENIQSSVVTALNNANYYSDNRGIKSDKIKPEYLAFTPWYGLDRSCSDCTRLLNLGNNPMSPRAGNWKAGALIEVVFFSNADDVEFLKRDDALDIISQGLYNGILNYVTQVK